MHPHTSCCATISLHHPLEQKRQKTEMSLNPDLAPRGASRFITVVRATLRGVFQVSLVMETVTTPPHTTVSLNMDCSVWLRSHCSWCPPFTNHARVTGTGSGSLFGGVGDRQLLLPGKYLLFLLQ